MKFLFALLCSGTLLLAGCFETKQEITLKDDGSGVFNNTNDMSALIGMAKQMGGKEQLDKMGESKMDTVISLSLMADSLKDISAEDREMVKKGSLKLDMDMSTDKFITVLSLPFTNPEQIGRLNQFAENMVQKIMMEQMAGDKKPEGMGDAVPSLGSISNYYVTTYSKGLIEKKLLKEKYAGVESDESMQGLKEVSSMGMPMNNTTIINLPRAAKKAEGKNIKLSDDKKTVTITASTEEFFDDASKLEFRIEY
jgi:hypothetical protein